MVTQVTKTKFIPGVIILCSFFWSCSMKNERAETEKSKLEVFVTQEGAVGGYDVVNYFTNSTPIKGDRQFTHEWNGAVWCFSNAENLNAFKTSPEKYAPQYGGYCAYGTANGHKAPTQPDAWTILNGKLYFNYSKDVQAQWSKSREEFIKKADKNWNDVKSQEF